MFKDKKKDYKLHVAIRSDEDVIENVVCEVYLPERFTDPVQLRLLPTKAQYKLLEDVFEFSMYGEMQNSTGEVQTTIQANQVYSQEGTIVYWEPELSERVFLSEPVDLTITEFLKEDISKNHLAKGTFWLTPNMMLSPRKQIERSYTGDVSVKTRYKFEFDLDDNVHLIFDKHYQYLHPRKDETLTFSELVAEFEIESEKQDIHTVLNTLDDFLMLTSFATRQRCICVGWDKRDSSTYTRFYRRDLAIPTESNDQSFNNTLIDQRYFKEFIHSAYKNFINSESQDLIRKAIYGTISSEEHRLESSFTALYSALETIILSFRRENQLEYVLAPKEWEKFSKRLKDYIKKETMLSGNENKERRNRIYEKLGELNRISFSTAFDTFCKHYAIDLQDLWPVIDRSEGISLSDIRNKLVHGETFNPIQEEALMTAKLHLKWIVERAILSVLRWPLHQSKVSPYTSRRESKEWQKEWQKERTVFSQGVD